MYPPSLNELWLILVNSVSRLPFESCSCGWNNSVNWQRGIAPLGYDYRDTVPSATKNINTEINYFVGNGKSNTAYFAKSFSLTSEEVNSTFNIGKTKSLLLEISNFLFTFQQLSLI